MSVQIDEKCKFDIAEPGSAAQSPGLPIMPPSSVSPEPVPSPSTSPLPLYLSLSSGRRLLIVLTIMMATLMEFLDTSIVNVAIPAMTGSLGTTLSQIGWVSTGYIISNVIILPLTGWLSDTFGRRRYLGWSVVLFTIASLGCGLSHNLGELILWRVFQGIGGAAFLATSQATLMEIFPPEKRGLAQAIFAIGVVIAPTLGPTLGGILTDNYSWPWIFLINVPVGACAALLTFQIVPDAQASGERRPADFPGILFLALGLGSLQTVLERGESEDWFASSFIVAFAVLATLGLLAFVFWSLRPANVAPAVNLRILTNRNLLAGALYGWVFGFVFYGMIFALPQFWQEVQGHTAEQSGHLLLPGGIATACILPLIGTLVGRIDARWLIGTGTAMFLGSALLLHSRLTLTTPDSAYFAPLILRGLGIGLQIVPLSAVALGTLPPQSVGEGAGIFNLFRQLGGSFGIAIITTLLTKRVHFHYQRLAEQIPQGSTLAMEWLAKARTHLMQVGLSPQEAQSGAFALLVKRVTQQAMVLSFQDVFWVIAGIAGAGVALLFLFQPVDGEAARRGAVAHE
jgi:DHA2 family multidrug resistance protein